MPSKAGQCAVVYYPETGSDMANEGKNGDLSLEKLGESQKKLYELLEDLRDEIRDNRRGGAGSRRRGGFPPFAPVPPPAMVAWLASWLFSPRRGDRDYDWYEAIKRFADTRDDFWERFDDCAYDSAEAMADIFHQFANATGPAGRDRRRRNHPRVNIDELEKRLDGMEHKEEVLEAVRRGQRMNEWVESYRRNNKHE